MAHTVERLEPSGKLTTTLFDSHYLCFEFVAHLQSMASFGRYYPGIGDIWLDYLADSVGL